tara:strand:+ start:1114 stop:2658 length:1545 start_codon:yes stop_codon:yes gene_type:complete
MSLNIYGKNPITLEKINIHNWLSESSDNILLIFDKKSNLSFSKSQSSKIINNEIIFCIKRSFLQTPNLNNIYIKCIIENGILLNDITYKSKENFFNLGYYLNKNLLIDLKSLEKSYINKNNIFKINFANNNYYDFINKEALALSIIGLAKKPSFKTPKNITQDEKDRLKTLHKQTSLKDMKIDKQNIPYKKDVYFESILSKALLDYSFQWDAPVNLYLRQGESYFETSIFKQYYRRYGTTLEEAVNNIKQKTEDLDRAFIEAATINQNSDAIYFRGMQMPFKNLVNIGDTEIIPNFISISTVFHIALRFSGIQRGLKCCVYKLKIAKGIPLIDMINTTKYKCEKEILLPRNLIFKLVKLEYIKFGIYNIPIACLNVDLRYNDQFRIVNNCKKFIVGQIEPYNPAYILQSNITKIIHEKFPIAKDENNKPIDIETNIKYGNIQDEAQNHSVPLVGKKCPKGYRINKTTGMCEFYDPTIKKTKKVKKEKIEKPEKIKKRCPNGTRKNKITGNCEPK